MLLLYSFFEILHGSQIKKSLSSSGCSYLPGGVNHLALAVESLAHLQQARVRVEAQGFHRLQKGLQVFLKRDLGSSCQSPQVIGAHLNQHAIDVDQLSSLESALLTTLYPHLERRLIHLLSEILLSKVHVGFDVDLAVVASEHLHVLDVQQTTEDLVKVGLLLHAPKHALAKLAVEGILHGYLLLSRTTRVVAGLSGNPAVVPHPFVVVRIVNAALLDLLSAPAEGRVALRAEHLVAAIDLEDEAGTSGAGLAVVGEQFGRLECVGITGVLSLGFDLQAVLAHVDLAEPALPRRGQEASAGCGRTRPYEYTAILFPFLALFEDELLKLQLSNTDFQCSDLIVNFCASHLFLELNLSGR